jgi:hypothetical protein
MSTTAWDLILNDFDEIEERITAACLACKARGIIVQSGDWGVTYDEDSHVWVQGTPWRSNPGLPVNLLGALILVENQGAETYIYEMRVRYAPTATVSRLLGVGVAGTISFFAGCDAARFPSEGTRTAYDLGQRLATEISHPL